MLCSVPEDDPEAYHRLKYAAAACGVMVARSKHPFDTRATLVAPNSTDATMIAVEESPALHALILKAPHERGLLAAFARWFDQEFENAEEIIEAQKPVWRECKLNTVFDALRREIPYYSAARFSFDQVPVENLRPLPIYLERFKLARLQLLTLIRELAPTASGILAQLPIVPPICERQIDGSIVVMDGTHRVYAAIQRGEKQIAVILIDDVDAPLPAKPQTGWSATRVTPVKRPRSERYTDYEEAYFRPIRTAFQHLVQLER